MSTPSKTESHHETGSGFELERIIFFSDAVFAIAITLLALELKVPDLGAVQTNQHLIQALLEQWSHFFAFALSFVIIAVFWVTHHRYYRHIIRYDGGLIVANFLILFFIVVMPFSTLLMGEYGNIPAGVWLYAINMFCLGLAGAWLWRHATHNHHLVAPNLNERFIRSVLLRAFSTPVAAVIVFILSFFFASGANVAWILIWLFSGLIVRQYQTTNHYDE